MFDVGSGAGKEAMDVVVERCAGLDVHKDTVVACVRTPGKGGSREQTTRTFKTMTIDLVALRDWLVAMGVTLVGMESTGVYWKPVFYVLEDDMESWLLNARHLRNVPGRKTDLLTELPRRLRGGCVPGRVGLARFATRDGRWRPAAGFGCAGGAGSGWFGGDRRPVPAVSAG